MGDAGVRHDSDTRRSNVSQIGDLAAMTCAHFQHGHVMLVPQLQYREWQTNFVVQISGCDEQRRPVTNMRPHNGGNHLLYRRLAIASRYRNDTDGKTGAPFFRERTEGVASVPDFDLR